MEAQEATTSVPPAKPSFITVTPQFLAFKSKHSKVCNPETFFWGGSGLGLPCTYRSVLIGSFKHSSSGCPSFRANSNKSNIKLRIWKKTETAVFDYVSKTIVILRKVESKILTLHFFRYNFKMRSTCHQHKRQTGELPHSNYGAESLRHLTRRGISRAGRRQRRLHSAASATMPCGTPVFGSGTTQCFGIKHLSPS